MKSNIMNVVNKNFYYVVSVAILFILMAILIPLDEGVPCAGAVSISTKRKVVQHKDGGLIDSIYVKEGDKVKSGQLLLQLRDSALEAQEKQLANSLNYLNSQDSALLPLVREGLYARLQYEEIKKQLEDTKVKLNYARLQIKNLKMTAPVDGQIIGFNKQTVGGVVQPGEKLFEVVPDREVLLIEVKVPTHFIDRVDPGSSVDVRFNNFRNTPRLVIDGVIDSIDGDVMRDEKSGLTYYNGRVNLTNLGQLDGREIQPGMQVEVVIKTGKRNLLNYILNPLIKRMAHSLKEE